ncbi:F-type ATPase subunit b [uncultured Roseburia sp.]|uniref:ATP synthase subunit b n=1 Tax=Brotonthovivens ammoniilytica TaxID=2981725 RepID=A0ABT2TPI1_9FIRM|nr:F0F1 ATP synthase subunit B [Brotonthovivens ammoniilytica]MCU6763606.1 F0F1 ATP synthase subunit B [Brotonthovivens ammoniilytica]SCJ26681.1 F-type ATPase subunit b [uncultured Roseburia sp.]
MLNLNPVNLICVVINILVLYLIVYKLLFKRVMGVIEQRKNMIEDDFSKARTAKAEALELKDQYEQTIKTAHDESARILTEARTAAKAEQQRIKAEADLQASEIIAKAHKSVEMEKEKTIQNTESEIAALAMLAAAKIMGQDDKRGNDSAIYDQFLKKAGDKNDAGSH